MPTKYESFHFVHNGSPDITDECFVSWPLKPRVHEHQRGVVTKWRRWISARRQSGKIGLQTNTVIRRSWSRTNRKCVQREISLQPCPLDICFFLQYLYYNHLSLFRSSDYVALRYVPLHGRTIFFFSFRIVAFVSASSTRPDDHCSNDSYLYSPISGQCDSDSRICIPSSYSDRPISMSYSKFVYDFDRFTKLISDISNLDMHFRLWQSVKWRGSHGVSCHHNHRNI